MSQDRDTGRTTARKRRTARAADGRAESGGIDGHAGSSTSPSHGLGTRAILAAAREQADALGWRWDGLVGLRRADGVWTVTVDVVETRRVPPTMDILAVYEMEIDREGELLGFRRRRHHVRGQGSG